MIDHRDSPGLQGSRNNVLGPGTLYESVTVSCGHCRKQVVLRPDRSRSRGYCPGCDMYVCDDCELVRVQTGKCQDFERFVDDYLNACVKGLPRPEFVPEVQHLRQMQQKDSTNG